MTFPDFINGVFELLGSVAIFAHVRRIRRDKKVAGVDWRATLFMSLWGYWNLFYYPQLDQWFSFVGGLAIVAGNTAWLYYLLKYRSAA